MEWSQIIITEAWIYELPHEIQNDLRVKTLENEEI